MNLLDALNQEQRNAAAVIDGPVLVLAGAGTGKTRVITYRMAHMIASGVLPSEILGMTFTNKAAREMKERLAALVGFDVAKYVTLGTFHAFCARLLRKEISRLGEFDANYTICSETDKKGIVRQAVIDLGLFHEEFPLDKVMYLIGDAKNSLDPEGFLLGDIPRERTWAREVYPRYQQILENQNMVDFDDLLLFTVRLLEDFPEVLEACREQWKYILVDEYQDTNQVQFRLLELLAGTRHNLCVVGDDDQSIYGWRGAQIQNILNFPEIFPNTKVVRLEQNYRSTSKILNAANAVIRENKGRYGKALWTDGEEGFNIQLIHAESNENESWFLADMIWEAKSQGHDWKDIAILYRSNHLSRTIEDAMRRQNIPYRVIGSKSFFQRKEVLDAAAYLRLCVNRRDDQSLLRILGTPPRGLGDKAVSLLKKHRQELNKPLTDILIHDAFLKEVGNRGGHEAKHLGEIMLKYHDIFKTCHEDVGTQVQNYLQEVGYLDGMLKIYKKFDEAQQRKENVEELINAIYRYEALQLKKGDDSEPPSLTGFLESYTLLDDSPDESNEEETDAVQLMTVHAAKGLEFPVVFLVGVEQGLFPHQRSLDEGSLEEERRLFYVAVTRAKARLFISHARIRFRYGEIIRQRPSEFLKSIPENLLVKYTTMNARWDCSVLT